MTHCGKKLIIILFFIGSFVPAHSKTITNHLIAHAGGSLNGEVYLNSKKAILNSIKNNFANIELDLKVTSDGKIYGLHAWKDVKKYSPTDIKILIQKDEKKKLVYNDLINFNKKNFFNILLEEDIVNIFKLNPNLIFFTDKINDFEKLNYLLKKINNKTYVEVYSLKDYLSAKRYGLKNIIYSSDLSNFDMFIINLFNINNVSVSKNFIDEKKKINFILNTKHNITFFCYTVNDYDFIKKYKKNIKYFFTDFLLPNELLSLK